MTFSLGNLGFVFDSQFRNGCWVLDRSVEEKKTLDRVCLPQVCILRSTFREVSFQHAECAGIAANWDEFFDCDFTGADLRKADFRASCFVRCRFDHANLESAELRSAAFRACSFADANMTNAVVKYVQSYFIGVPHDTRKRLKRVWRPATPPPGG